LKREMHDGRKDGLEGLEAIDVRSVKGFADMLQKMSKTAFGGRRLGEAYSVLRDMAEDESCTIIVTVSGAMTIAKMGRVLCEMIESELADIVITTGAMMAHGLSEVVGGIHYKHDPSKPDSLLFKQGYNRVYDTLEMELNLTVLDKLMNEVMKGFDWSRPTCSFKIHEAIGRRLAEKGLMPSILGCAYQKGVPVYVPAFTDSEVALDLATFFLARNYKKKDEENLDVFFSKPPPFNPFMDLYDFARRVCKAETLGIFTIGGGVPRNWGQQMGPFTDLINARLGLELPPARIKYGIRICPEPVHWGGLSGCTYSEGVSWGKFLPVEEGGRFAEVYCDATIAWPLLLRAVLEDKKNSHSSGE
jgi:deoxyhypusine synthase